MPLVDGAGAYLGALVFGQVRPLTRPPRQPKNRDMARLFRQLPAMSEAALREIGDLLKVMTEYMVDHEVVRRRARQWHEVLEEYIQHHFHERLSLSDLARAVNRSPSFLSHQFKGAFGRPPAQYVREKRLQAAHARLLKGALVKQVAQQLGFADEFHFSKVFTKRFGKPPSEVRGSP